MPQKPNSFILLISKGILRDRTQRRTVMFWIVAATLAQLAAGVFVLDAWLLANPVIFLLYWGACFWLTITSLLLALYDMLALRVESRRERERIKGQVFGGDNDKDKQP